MINASQHNAPCRPFVRVLACVATLLFTSIPQASGTAQAVAEEVQAGGPPLVRRLTEHQYRTTIEDIFGADIAVVGRFERALRSDGLLAVGTSEAGLSAFAIEQYNISARSIAAEVLSASRRDGFLPCKVEDARTFNTACAREFVADYGLRLFRRPLSDAEEAVYVSLAENAHATLGDFYRGLEFALTGLLVAPDFLLRVEHAVPDSARPGRHRLDDYSSATRLSYFLTGAAPDTELLAAAGAGRLREAAELEKQVDRLMASPRFESTVRDFFADMLHFDLFADLAKDAVIYPAFNSDVAADAREQTLRTVTHHLLDNNGDYRDLFTTRAAPLTRSLGMVYQLPVAARHGWAMSEFPASSGRAGIQSQVSFLALHSHPGRSSPTLRGRAIREIFLCQHVPDPPADVDFTGINDTANPDRPTARDRLEIHRTQPICAACHTLMDPIGLTLENFDGLGIYRTRENNMPIDVSGALDGREFNAATGLGQALHDHPQTTACLVDKLYRYGVGRNVASAEQDYLQQLNEVFSASGYQLPALVRHLATSPGFYAVTPNTQNLEITAAHTAPGDDS